LSSSVQQANVAHLVSRGRKEPFLVRLAKKPEALVSKAINKKDYIHLYTTPKWLTGGSFKKYNAK